MEFIKNFSIYKSNFAKDEPKCEISEIRKFIDEGTKNGDQPFSQAVNFVNKNLASHGDNNISLDKAKTYVSDSNGVEKGEISNSYAFGKSAIDWFKKGNMTGGIMNTGGMFLSGAVDHKNFKLGKF